MREWNNILVVCQPGAETSSILKKVKRLADIESDSTVNAVRIVYDASIEQISDDGQSAEALRRYVEDSAKTELENEVADGPTDIEFINCHAIWSENIAQGVLSSADQLDADVIIKPVARSGEQRLLRTPDDWNLLRGAQIPVLLCGAQPWSKQPALLAAIDAQDASHETMNTRILRLAAGLSDALHGKLNVATAYPSVSFWSANPSIFNSYQTTLKRSEDNARQGMSRLLSELDMEPRVSLALEGKPENVIQQVIEEAGVELLVIGNSRRDGVPGLLLGNTAEQLVYAISEDLLCVP